MNLEMLRRMTSRRCKLARKQTYDHVLTRFGHDGQMYNMLDRCWTLEAADGTHVCLLWQSDILISVGTNFFRSAL